MEGKSNTISYTTAIHDMIRMELNGEGSARNIQAELKLPVENRCVEQIISAVQYKKYKKMINEPHMTQTHRENRVKWVSSISVNEKHFGTVPFSATRISLVEIYVMNYNLSGMIYVRKSTSKRQKGRF